MDTILDLLSLIFDLSSPAGRWFWLGFALLMLAIWFVDKIVV